jgi:hypothetical protein
VRQFLQREVQFRSQISGILLKRLAPQYWNAPIALLVDHDGSLIVAGAEDLFSQLG